MSKLIIFIVSLLLLLPAMPMHAGKLKGVEMKDTITVAEQALVLNGMALRKKVFFKVYVAGLYLPQKEKDGTKILKDDTPRRVELHFLRSVGAKKMSNAWFEGLKENTPNHSPELKKQFDELASMMEKMKDGERMIYTYIPGKGTEINLKGKVKGTIEGKAFADALFACWIGPEPGPGEGFKEDLLGH